MKGQTACGQTLSKYQSFLSLLPLVTRRQRPMRALLFVYIIEEVSHTHKQNAPPALFSPVVPRLLSEICWLRIWWLHIMLCYHSFLSSEELPHLTSISKFHDPLSCCMTDSWFYLLSQFHFFPSTMLYFLSWNAIPLEFPNLLSSLAWEQIWPYKPSHWRLSFPRTPEDFPSGFLKDSRRPRNEPHSVYDLHSYTAQPEAYHLWFLIKSPCVFVCKRLTEGCDI